jgi:hypothetical protein
MVFSARLARVSEASEFLEKNLAVCCAMHFADNARALLFQEALGTAKHFHFVAFYVTFQKVRRRRDFCI